MFFLRCVERLAPISFCLGDFHYHRVLIDDILWRWRMCHLVKVFLILLDLELMLQVTSRRDSSCMLQHRWLKRRTSSLIMVYHQLMLLMLLLVHRVQLSRIRDSNVRSWCGVEQLFGVSVMRAAYRSHRCRRCTAAIARSTP